MMAKARDETPPIEYRIAANGPFPDLDQASEQHLAIDDIRPLVRIAHRQAGVLNIPDRIIFDHELVLFTKGEGALVTQSATFRYSAHHLFCIPPFLPHSFTANATVEHVAVHFDLAPGVPHVPDHPELRRPYRIAFSHGSALPFHRVLSPQDGVEALLLDLLRNWQRQTPASRLAVQACLQRALATLLESSDKKPFAARDTEGARQRARIERSLAYIQDHFADQITSNDIAKAAGLSPSRFSQVFRQWTGHSPKEYLRRVRIDQARALLADIDLSVKEVASRTGFDDQYHFSRIFRQIDGLSPTLYREAVLAGRR